MSDLKKVRIDKWLWSVRIFKSRSIATEACKGSKIKINGTAVKASYLVSRGETIDVKKEGFNHKYKVVDLIQKRVSATLAQPCYEDLTPEGELDKHKDWYNIRANKFEQRTKGEGRPTKRERRTIEKFKKEG